MKKCVICRNDILNEDPAIFFEAIDGIQKEVCPKCEEQIDIMMESDNVEEAKSAVNYLYTCYLSNTDEEVKKVIKISLEENSKEIIRKEKEIAGQNPVDSTKTVDYFSDYIIEENTDVSNWISILNITTFIYVIILSIASFTFIFTMGPLGFIVSIVYVLGILLLLSLIKIIINMSKEVTDIKKVLNKNKNL